MDRGKWGTWGGGMREGWMCVAISPCCCSENKVPSGAHHHPDIEAWTYRLSSTVVTFVRCFYSEPYFAVHFYVFDASSLVPDLDTDEDEVRDW